ncbi:ester cyclase [Yeosuana marina]|uniref:ester cyclase n=1 Tax=Yeosuana marina TaxID=1565536 RepID=UPI0030EBF586|tara:strand:+ start:2746 stop:3255 length:510 start_codon:yes stop_codon:yes gene_type:complete
MKSTFFLIFSTLILLIACQQQIHYTQQSPEINTYKKVIEAYEKQDWKDFETYYANSAQILNNVTIDNAQSVSQLIEQNKEDAKLFTSWKYNPESVEYEMVVTDKGETWVNFWGHWEANLKANGKRYVIPAHITAQFIDGKIVREDGYWDISKLMTDMQAIEASKNIQTE